MLQAANHDFASITLTPTVTLLHDFPEKIDGSWYRGQPYVYLKITATEPSTAIPNAAEIKEVLLSKYGCKEEVPPILIMYTDGGPEHRTTFLTVKLAAIYPYKSLNLDMILHLRTAPGHSYRNPPERVNCILNLELYGIGSMRQQVYEHPEFEKKLSNCNNISQMRNLINEDPVKNTELVRDSCKQTMNLMRNVFHRLSLKKNHIITKDPIQDSDIDFDVGLDECIKGGESGKELKDLPILKQFLDHCCQERTYFFSIKKCGKDLCTRCNSVRLPYDVFERLHHLPDPIPDPTNEGHY